MPGRGAGGRIVNVAARHALDPRLGASLTAYAVAPSIMDTPANRKSMPKADFDAWPKVEEVAAAIMFLASPENKVTRGAIVPVYGKF